MSNSDSKKKIVAYIKKSKPRSSNQKVISQDDFLDGVIAQVQYTNEEVRVKQ